MNEPTPSLPATTPARLRVFSASASQPRYRRATDAFLLGPSALAVVLLVVAYPPSRFEQSLDRWLQSLPGFLGPVWVIFFELLAVWAVALLVLTIVARRPVAWLPALGAGLIALVLALLAGRIAGDDWQNVVDGLRGDSAAFPALRGATCGALILAIGPHLTRPLERFGRWLAILGTLGVILGHGTTTGAGVAAALIAIVSATLVRLVVGTSAGQPDVENVLAALRSLGVHASDLEPAARQQAGAFVARGADQAGHRLLVKVYGRDAYDTQLLEKLWRTVMYRSDGTRLRLSRLDAIEHEALVTLLATQAGVPTNEVIIAAESGSGDALLVQHDRAQRLAELAPDEIKRLLPAAWDALDRLATAGIAHNRVDLQTLALVEGRVGFVDLDRAVVAPRPDLYLLDRARLLAATAAATGAAAAVSAGRTALGAAGLAALLPYLQPAAFGQGLRRTLKDADLDPGELRELTATAAGAETVEPVKLRRLTWWTVAQVVLLALAVSTVVGAVAGLDHESFRDYVAEASWGWIVLGALVAQLPRLTQALATLGSVPAKLPFVPVYAMQLATGYMNLALPSNFARMAINIRFFQRQGIPPATAVTAGAIDSFASTVVQAALLLGLIVLSAGSLDFDLDLPSGPPVEALLIAVGIGLMGIAALVATRRIRTAIAERVRHWWPDVRATVMGLRSGSKFTLLVGGSLATELLFAIALGVFARAFGFDVGLVDLLLINISVSLLASFLPVPGGIGVAEFGLTVGLVAAGLPEEVALVVAVLYRIATFYAPPLWGFFAMRWLSATDRL